MPKIDTKPFEILGQTIFQPPPKDPPPGTHADGTWEPDLNPTQKKAWDCDAKYLLLWGPKGGAKSYGAVHKLMKHCYENENALALIVVRTQNMAKKGGAWDMLVSEIAPTWKEGLGIEISDVKTDNQHYQYIWVENQFGTWCMIAIMSCPVAHQLRDRVRGMSPSMVFVDELTSCQSHYYFQSIAAQLGRRPFVQGVQQYIAACNPEGPSHWVYKQWFVIPYDEETDRWDPDFVEMFFPREENRRRMPAGYFEGLAKIYKGDAIESARMEEGEWVDRPSGEALFGEIFNVIIHMAPLNEEGNPDRRLSLMPHVDYPIILGLDPGQVYNAYIFQQRVPIDGKMKWVIFDEIVTLRRKIIYPRLIPIIMARIRWWRTAVGREMPQVWISDNSAFNQFRAATGSYDVLDIERIYEENRARFHLEPLKIRQCPKFQGSVLARVQLMQKALAQDETLISSRCGYVQRMLMNLEGKKGKEGELLTPEEMLTPQRSDHVHTFDATTYPWLAASLSPTALVPSEYSAQTLISAAA